MLRALSALSLARVAPTAAPRVRGFATTARRAGFWDNILPLIQGNRRERQLQRKQGGLLPDDYKKIQEDQRREAMIAAQSYTGEALVEDSFDTPEIRSEEAQRRSADTKRERRLLRKRWGGLTAPGGVEKAEHKYSTAVFRISPRKLNMLAQQVNGKPIDFAILQMQFSAKRAARRIRSTLVLARDHAAAKGMDPRTLVVSEAWVTKGTFLARLEIKGRGRAGIMHHPRSRMHIVLRPGKSWEQREEEKIERARRHVRSMRTGGVVRGNPKVVNGFQRPGWAW